LINNEKSLGKIVIFHTFEPFKKLKIRNHQKVDMKKIILGVAISSLAISCQKMQAGGNKGVLRMEEGAERYSDDVMSDEATAKVQKMQAAKYQQMKDTTKIIAQPMTEVKKDTAMQVKSATPAMSAEKK
jgi:hypothetical protein